MTMQRDYAKAIELLNSLQSNAQTISKMNHKASALTSLPEMRQYLDRIGYKPAELDRLSFVHVAGTKGKGSTCAFTTSILGQFNINGQRIKTGLYTSPHLLEVRERIRINGEPLSKDKFAKYFFNIWDRLEATNTETSPQRPAYFRYMTLLSFHTFMEEKCDAVVLEVGIGGEYDCTNVISSPLVTGISSLGIDHVSILGHTIEEITWHKAGIMKENCMAVSVPQPESALAVISKRAQELRPSKLLLLTTSDIDTFGTANNNLGLAGKHQKLNAALASTLVEEWIRLKRDSGSIICPVDASISDRNAISIGLQKASWPGRCQQLQHSRFPGVSWYLDGAHTRESLEVCAEWFVTNIKDDKSKALIFNCTHQRHGKTLFPGLLNKFKDSGVFLNRVIFTTNDPYSEMNVDSGDLVNNMVDPDPEQKTQQELKHIFLEMAVEMGILVNYDNVAVVKSAQDAILLGSDCQQILITGSLHLVGSALTVFSRNLF